MALVAEAGGTRHCEGPLLIILDRGLWLSVGQLSAVWAEPQGVILGLSCHLVMCRPRLL